MFLKDLIKRKVSHLAIPFQVADMNIKCRLKAFIYLQSVVFEFNRFTIMLLLLLFSTHLQAQEPDWLWARNAQSSSEGEGEGWNVATDAFGNVYITGMFTDTISFGSNTFITEGYSSYLAKYDASGTLLWVKNSGGVGACLVNGISTDASGNVYICGEYNVSFVTFDDDTLQTLSDYNIFIVKFDSSGSVKWAAAAAGSNNDFCLSISSDAYNNMYITGYYFSPTISFGNVVLTNSGFYDSFIVKYDSSGAILWALNAGGSGYDLSNSIKSDLNGNSFITGYFNSPEFIFGTDTLSTAGNFEMFVAKVDSAGNVLWARKSSGNNLSSGMAVTTNLSGNSFVTGKFNADTIWFGSICLQNTDTSDNAFLVKYDPTGNVVWAKCYSGGLPYNMAIDSIDNLYICGSLMHPLHIDTLLLPMPVDSADAMFICKFDSTGNGKWAKSLASGGDDNSGIATGLNGVIYLTGDYEIVNPFVIGNDTMYRTGIEDVFVAKLGFPSPPSVQPLATFSSSDTVFCEKQCLDFYDQSANNPTSWQWFFPGADSAASTLQNPTNICYNNYGSFDVTLIACNSAGCDTLTLTGFIVSIQNPSDSIYISNDTLYSLPASSYQWYETTSGIIAGATSQFYIITQPGSYYCITSNDIGCIATSNTITLTSLHPEISGPQFAISPNPNDGTFDIKLLSGYKISSHQYTDITVADAVGKIVFSSSLKLYQSTIHLKLNLDNGIYILKMMTGNNTYRQEFIIKK